MATRLEMLYAQTVLSNLRAEFRDWVAKEQDATMRYCWRASETAVDEYITDIQQKLDRQ